MTDRGVARGGRAEEGRPLRSSRSSARRGGRRAPDRARRCACGPAEHATLAGLRGGSRRRGTRRAEPSPLRSPGATRWPGGRGARRRGPDRGGPDRGSPGPRASSATGRVGAARRYGPGGGRWRLAELFPRPPRGGAIRGSPASTRRIGRTPGGARKRRRARSEPRKKCGCAPPGRCETSMRRRRCATVAPASSCVATGARLSRNPGAL